MKRMGLMNFLRIIIRPLFVVIGYICIFILSYRVVVGLASEDILDHFLSIITLVYTIYYAPIVFLCIKSNTNVGLIREGRRIAVCVFLETFVILFNFIMHDTYGPTFPKRFSVAILMSNMVAFACFVYILWTVSGALITAEGRRLDPYRQFGYALLMYFNFIGAYVIWRKIHSLGSSSKASDASAAN